MRRRWIALYAALMLIGAALIKPIAEGVPIVGWLSSFEIVHVVAHLFLYGSLMTIGLRSGLSERRAALVTLTIAAMQEGVQLIVARRAPGLPELFDLGVDSIAVVIVVLVSRRRRSAVT